MTISLGLDIGSNSVGSAWVDTQQAYIDCGVSVFQSGVEQKKDDERGEPINRERRQKRQLRKALRRRAIRRRKLLAELISRRLLPSDASERAALFGMFPPSPWHLRRDGLYRELTPYEFGRVLIHLNQRRGAFGVHVQNDEAEIGAGETGEVGVAEGKVRDSLRRLNKTLGGKTFGEFIAGEYDKRKREITGKPGKYYCDPVRNRTATNAYEFCAGRDMVHDEFLRLWEKQQSYDGPLAKLLTPEFKGLLDCPSPKDAVTSKTWHHAGLIFGQRRHYWNVGTLGRCDLEPSDRCCPIGDRHASYFRVVETVNNIRLWERGKNMERELTEQERAEVISRLRSQKTGSVAAVREALKIDKKSLKKKQIPPDFYRLNLEADEDREINTDWFHRDIVLGVFGEQGWNALGEKQQESVSRTLLRLDAESPNSAAQLEEYAEKWWGLKVKADRRKLRDAWQKMPQTEKRLKLSRRAILNLLPLMERANPHPGEGKSRWRTATEARQEFAENPHSNATLEQRVRYAHWISPALRGILLTAAGGDEAEVQRLLSLRGMNAADRRYLKKHPGLLPPAPEMPNPVVRKAIHEVRRHIIAYMRKYCRKPDRIVLELARETTQPRKLRDQQLKLNRRRQLIRREIICEFQLAALSKSERETAVDRVILCKQQKEVSAYTGAPITPRNAANGQNDSGDALEIDHVIPRASGGGDGWSNLVLCYAKENRDKGKRSPIQWPGLDFERFEAVLRHLEKGQDNTGGYFTAKECVRKWENLHHKARPDEEWRPSQLTDTSYAAKAVAEYLQSSLFSDDPVEENGQPKRRIFFTKGRYTAKLRSDWKLFEKLRDPRGANDEVTTTDPQDLAGEAKNRGDHRHHAIDAVAIALCDSAILTELGRRIRKYDEDCLSAKARCLEKGAVPKPRPIDPPLGWSSAGAFRRAVLSRMYDEFDASDESGRKLGRREKIMPDQSRELPWGVSHRPVNRRIVGAFHKDMLYGPVFDHGRLVPDRVTIRKPVLALKPEHLRPPLPESRAEAIERIARDLVDAGTKRAEARLRAEEAVNHTGYRPRLVAPSLGKAGIVRDSRVRAVIRERLKKRGLDPDEFTPAQLKAALDGGRNPLTFPESGVPIKSVVLLRPNTSPFRVERRTHWNPQRRKLEAARDDKCRDRELRLYDAQSNHHIEFRLDSKIGGGWIAEVVRTADVAERLRKRLDAVKEAVKKINQIPLSASDKKDKIHEAVSSIHLEYPLVDRRDNERGKFILSLAKGETVWMKHPETGIPSYFVVFKIDPTNAVHFIHHTDAWKSKGSKGDGKNVLPGSIREDVGAGIVPSRLRSLGVEPYKHPVKVRIDPLGNARVIERD